MSETKTMSSTKTTSTEQVRFLTVTAIGIALVYVFTWLINIRLPFAPQGGLIHLGNVPLFIFAIVFGKKLCSKVADIVRWSHCKKFFSN